MISFGVYFLLGCSDHEAILCVRLHVVPVLSQFHCDSRLKKYSTLSRVSIRCWITIQFMVLHVITKVAVNTRQNVRPIPRRGSVKGSDKHKQFGRWRHLTITPIMSFQCSFCSNFLFFHFVCRQRMPLFTTSADVDESSFTEGDLVLLQIHLPERMKPWNKECTFTKKKIL